MKRYSLPVLVLFTLLLLFFVNAWGSGDSGDSNTDGDENNDGDVDLVSDGDDFVDGDYSEDAEDIEVDGDKNSDGDFDDNAGGDTDGDSTEEESPEYADDSEDMESDGDTDETADGDETPEPSGIDGYLVAVLYNLNTPDYTGNEISLLRLTENGQWAEENVVLTVHDNPRAATFTPNGNRLIVTHDSGWISIFDIRNGQATMAWDIETDGYYEQIQALDYDRVLLMDGNHVINGGGLAILDISAEPPFVVDDLLPFSAPAGFAMHPSQAKAAVFGVTPMDSKEKYTNDMALVDTSDFPELISYFNLWGDENENVNPMSHWPGFSPDGGTLAGGNDAMWGLEIGTVKLLSYNSGEITFLDSDEVNTPSSYVFSDDSNFLYIGAVESNRIEICDVFGGTMEFVENESSQDLVEDIIPIRKGPLSGHLLSGPYDGPVLLKDDQDGTLTEISRFALDIEHDYMVGGLALGHEYE